MRLARILFLFIFLISSCLVPVYTQPEDLPISNWVRELSSKKSIAPSVFRSVVQSILALDSAQQCDALTLLSENSPRGKRYQLRMIIIQFQLQINGFACGDQKWTDDKLKEAILAAYEIEDQQLMVDFHQALATYYLQQFNLGSAGLHALTAIDLTEKAGKNTFHIGGGGWYSLGYVLFHSREYEASIRATSNALQAGSMPNNPPGDTLNILYRMNALNTIGLAYEKLGKADSAFLAFDRALKIAQQQQSDFWVGVIKGNIGDVYFQLGQYDSAAVLLRFDYEQSLAAGQYDNAANSLQWLARIDLHHGQANAALQKLNEARTLLQRIYTPAFMEHTLKAYTQVFAALGNADSTQNYMNRYMILHDSLEMEAYNSRAEVVNMRMENQSNVYTIMTLHKEKKKIALIRNFIIVLILLLIIVGFLLFNRQKLKFKIHQHAALESQRKAEADAAESIQRLNDFTQNLVAKTSLIEKLKHQLLHKETNADQIQRISELTQHTILTEEDWEKFKALFEKVYPGFFHALRIKSVDITGAELRMAALCKLQVPSKEAANLLGISPNSVNKTRQRLRHRLGLDTEVNLELYFMQQETF